MEPVFVGGLAAVYQQIQRETGPSSSDCAASMFMLNMKSVPHVSGD